MRLPDSIVDAVTAGTLPRLALVVAVMIIRHPQDVYRLNQIAEWCGIARRTTFLMLTHLRDVHFEIIQVKSGLKIHQIPPQSTEIAPYSNSALECTPLGQTEIPSQYPDKKAREWALDRYPGYDITAAARNFRAHHILSNSQRLSWEAAWRSWMKRAHKDTDHAPPRATSISDAIGIALSKNPFDTA